jgi:hypothetical protein
MLPRIEENCIDYIYDPARGIPRCRDFKGSLKGVRNEMITVEL